MYLVAIQLLFPFYQSNLLVNYGKTKPCGKANISSKTELPLVNKFFRGKFLEICHYIQERFIKPFSMGNFSKSN